MLIDWQPDNRPEAAVRIAHHTAQIIDAMNRVADARAVKQLFDDYMKFARDHRVCSQIVQHMVDKRRILVGEMDRPKVKPASISEASRRMAGDRDE